MPHLLAYVLIGLFGLFSFGVESAEAAGTSDESSETEAGAPAYAAAKAAVDAKDFATALPLLEALTAAEPQNADAWNLLGFSNRKIGHLDIAAVAYTKALTINPGHLGALEYQGEMYLEMGEIDKARANLDRLVGLCGSCEEQADLAEALEKAGS